jgi:hypothetical protein
MASLVGRIATWRANVVSAGLDDRLWVKHREAWEVNPTDESEETPHDPQMLAALQSFCWMFGGAILRAWVHLAAEMQAGKSGVANALIRLVLKNVGTLNIDPSRIFVLTGMSDDAWRKQTRARVPHEVRPNVHHSGGLNKVRAQFHKLAGVDGLRNILVILDESQVASTASNRPNKMVYETIRGLVPPEQWVARNIRILTISATDPAKVMSMEGCAVPNKVVRLLTTPEYQSVETLSRAGRIRALETFGDISSVKAMSELMRAVSAYTTPLWHVIRPRQGKTAEVESKLRTMFPQARVVAWDSTAKKAPAADESASESTESLEDINTLLATPPETHSFVLLKNMFYASKTLNDEHVGVLWDRMGGVVGGDNARLQSLLGRACGYGKSSRTVVYTSNETVDRYLTFWRELCHSVDASTETADHKAGALNRRMPGVVAVATENGSAKVAPAKNCANPVANSSNAAAALAAHAAPAADESKFDVEWREFSTFADAKAYASRIHEPKSRDSAGFITSSTTGKLKRLSYADALAMQGGKKTGGFDVRKLDVVGKSQSTLYPCYRNLNDIHSIVYMVGKITRSRA